MWDPQGREDAAPGRSVVEALSRRFARRRSLLEAAASLLPASLIRKTSALRWKHPLLKAALDRVADRFRRRVARIQRGPGKGLRIDPGRSKAGYVLGTSETPVQEAFRRLIRPGMTIYDVGADAGFLTLIAARLTGPEGRVVSFEPLESNAGLTERNAVLNGFSWVSVRREALGAQDGRERFLVSSVPSWGRLESCGAPGGLVGDINVAVRRLDSLLDEAGLPAPDLVKIDVEGAEVDVLAGAAGILSHARPILLIEVHGTNLALADYLERLGYEAIMLGGGRLEDCLWGAHVLARDKRP